MMIEMKKKVKVAFIEDKKARKATSKKRTKVVLKKLGELWKLCNVKACLILFLRPSKEGVEELCSKFMDLSPKKKKMVNQKMTKPDQKDGEFQKLCEEKLREEGESFSSLRPPSLRPTSDVFQRWYDHKVPSQNLYEDYAKIFHEFNAEHNLIPIQKEPVKFNCQALYDFYAEIPQKLEAFNKKYNINTNHNLIPYSKNIDLMNSETNPSLNEKQGFMDISKEQMDDAGEHESISSVDSSSP